MTNGLTCVNPSAEGFPVIMFGTQGVDHKFHIVATVLSSSEDQEAHEQAYSAIVREVESIVHDRSSRNIPI